MVMKFYDCMGLELKVGDKVLYLKARRSTVYKEKRIITQMDVGYLKLDGKNARCNVEPHNVLLYPWHDEANEKEDVTVS